MNLKDQIETKIAELNAKRLFIHSDLLKGFKIPFTTRGKIPPDHIKELYDIAKNCDIWMPAFNYSFCNGEDFSLVDTRSEVGVLSEYFRTKLADWRTKTPVFSITGIGVKPELKFHDEIDPFDESSAFHLLDNDESVIMHYGSELRHTTIIHYVERISSKLSYRYDKIFRGKVIDEAGISKDVKLKYHVRPMGFHLDYDWDKLYNDLKENQILFTFVKDNTYILLIKTKELIDFWNQQLAEDNMYLLDKESKAWIIPKLNELGRAFKLTDFE